MPLVVRLGSVGFVEVFVGQILMSSSVYMSRVKRKLPYLQILKKYFDDCVLTNVLQLVHIHQNIKV